MAFLDDQCLVELVRAPIAGDGGLPRENHTPDVRLEDQRAELPVVIKAFRTESGTEGEAHFRNLERKRPIFRHVEDVDTLTANEIAERLLVSPRRSLFHVRLVTRSGDGYAKACRVEIRADDCGV